MLWKIKMRRWVLCRINTHTHVLSHVCLGMRSVNFAVDWRVGVVTDYLLGFNGHY